MSRNRRAVRRNPAQEPEQQLGQAVAHELSQRVEVFRGPLPPPAVLKAYNEAHPDAADRILRMAEEQGQHRRRAEAKELSRADRGQVFGFVIAMTALVGGIVLLLFNKDIQGYTTIGTGIASLVAAFTIGRVSQARERRRKPQK